MLSPAGLAASPFQGSQSPVVAAAATEAAHGAPLLGDQHRANQEAVAVEVAAALAAAAFPAWQGANEEVLVGQCTLPGSRYGNLNQDYVISHQLHDAKHLKQHRWPQCYITAVLDGHGMLGEVAAREAGTHILHALKHSDLRHRQLADMAPPEAKALLRRSFAEGHAAALRIFDAAPHTYIFPLGSSQEQRYTLRTHSSGDKVYSSPYIGNRILEYGTSATVAILQGTSLVIADVGDSLAVLGRDEGDCYEGDIVSVRHFGWDADERERLAQECGARVSVSPEDGYLTVEEGRLRGFQLAMTRALGHRLLSGYGVSAEPSVTFHVLRPEHICLIVATDGVWEVLSPSEAVKLVCDVMAEGRSAEAAAAELCREAVRLASSLRQAGLADNTTATVFVFDEL